MWDELVNSFDLTVTKEDIKRYNEMKKKERRKYMNINKAVKIVEELKFYESPMENHKEAIETVLEDYISKQRIEHLMFTKLKEIIKNNVEIEKRRKTIMKEQALKRLNLGVLHHKNDVLLAEIYDLQKLIDTKVIDNELLNTAYSTLKLKELNETLESLLKMHQARLDAGTDDLDIREQIAEVQKEITNLY